MNRNPVLIVIFRAAALVTMLLLAGCGGGTTSATSAGRKAGRLQVTVKWPPYESSTSSGATKQARTQSGRLIAYNATSISITVTPPLPNSPQQFTVTRANPTHTFNLPTGDSLVDVQELTDDSLPPNTSNVLASSAQTTITINANQDTPLVVAPLTTIQSLQLTPQTSTLQAGSTLQVTAMPLNGTGEMVPIPPNVLTFSTDNAAVASIDAATGVVTGNAFGSAGNSASPPANITAVLDVNKLGSVAGNASYSPIRSNSVVVSVMVKISISPAAANLAVQSTIGTGQATQYSNTQQFTASVQGDSGNVGVTWSIDEPNGGNLIPVGGTLPLPNTIQYIAPNTSGTFHVRATSKTDNTTYAEVTVTVVAGSLIVNAN